MTWTYDGIEWTLSPLGVFFVSALFLAGLFFFVRYLVKTENRQNEKKHPAKKEAPSPAIKKKSNHLASLDIVESAKIAQQTIKSFNPAELLEVSDFIPKSEIMEALQGLHERLRPTYEYNLMKHYENKLQIKNVAKEEIASQVNRCMEQGFEGILKLEELQGLFGEGADKNVGRAISKGRSWSEISGKSD